MKLFTRSPSRDPRRIREGLQQLCDDLSEVLGSDLESVNLYGSFARDERLETESDTVNVLFVLRRVDCQLLDKMTEPVSCAEKEIPLATMTLTREDLHSSCDVFPIKFHEMKLHHQLLAGEDVLSNLAISDDHLRLRCEQQLKNLMLRLRAIYLHRNQNSRQLLETLLDANRGFLQDIHACLVVKTGVVPEDETDLAAAFDAEFGLDTKVINEILNLRRHAQVPEAEDLKRIFDRFMRLVHDAALAVDQMEVQS